MKNTQKIVTILAALAVGLIASLAVLSYPSTNNTKAVAEVTDDLPGIRTGPVFTAPDKYARETGQSAAIAEVTQEEILLKRGESTTIEVLVKHLGGTDADESINVELLPPIGYILYPPSIGESTTAEERAQAAISGKPIPGTIDLATFVTISGPSEKAIEKSGQQVYSYVITIPKDLPDEFVGDAIYVPINIKPTDMDGKDIPGIGTGINVLVN